jgi:hypothetical protein
MSGTLYRDWILQSNVIKPSGHPLNSTAYSVAPSGTFYPDIDRPFLLERVTIELPIIASGCNSLYQTQVFFDYGITYLGGPGITVALLRQSSPTQREVVHSALFSHNGDSINPGAFGGGAGAWGTAAGSNPSGLCYFSATMPGANFSYYPTTYPAYTGSVILDHSVKTAAGVLGAYSRTRAGNYATASAADSYPLAAVPYGTGYDGNTSGRKYFGASTRSAPLDISASFSASFAFDFESFAADREVDHDDVTVTEVMGEITHTRNPYLLFPGDPLLLCFSQARFYTPDEPGVLDPAQIPKTGTKINVGEITVKLYGAYVSEGQPDRSDRETADPSDDVRTGGRRVPDSFVISDAVDFSGSMSSEQMTGSLVRVVYGANNQRMLVTGSRTFRGSLLDTRSNPELLAPGVTGSLAYVPRWEACGFERHLTLVDSESREWDSVLPDVFETIQALTASSADQTNPYGTTGYVALTKDPLNDVQANNMFVTVLHHDIRAWDGAYPFEAKLAGVTRTVKNDPQTGLKKFTLLPDTGAFSYNPTGSVKFGYLGFSENVTVAGQDIYGGIPVLTSSYRTGGSFDTPTWSGLLLICEPSSQLGFEGYPYSDPSPAYAADYLNHFFGVGGGVSTIQDYYRPLTPASQSSTIGGSPVQATGSFQFSRYSLQSVTCRRYQPILKTSFQPSRFLAGYKMYGASNPTSFVSSSYPEGVPTVLGYGSVLRGYRYGISSISPRYLTSHWRRDSYGQFRDMLEGRPTVKTYFVQPDGSGQASVGVSPVEARFVSPDGLSVDPLLTDCCNLSFECTASVPFTDGVLRNRTAPTPTKLISSALKIKSTLGSSKTKSNLSL